jgi:hypothetical protein
MKKKKPETEKWEDFANLLYPKPKKKPKEVKSNLPKAKHKLGYTYAELETFLNESELDKFRKWIRGQTCAFEDGVVYTYTHDVERFVDCVLKGKPTYWD